MGWKANKRGCARWGERVNYLTSASQLQQIHHLRIIDYETAENVTAGKQGIGEHSS